MAKNQNFKSSRIVNVPFLTFWNQAKLISRKITVSEKIAFSHCTVTILIWQTLGLLMIERVEEDSYSFYTKETATKTQKVQCQESFWYFMPFFFIPGQKSCLIWVLSSNMFFACSGRQQFFKEIDYVRNKQSSIPIWLCISCVRRRHWLLFKTCAAYERMRQSGEYKYVFKRQFMYFRFYSGGNTTDANCTEVLLSTDYADPDATINCKLTEEIFPKYLDQLQTCKENFPPYGRFVYSCSSMIIQYLLPTITISIGKYELRHFIQYYIFRVLNVCIFLFKCIDICIT